MFRPVAGKLPAVVSAGRSRTVFSGPVRRFVLPWARNVLVAVVLTPSALVQLGRPGPLDAQVRTPPGAEYGARDRGRSSFWVGGGLGGGVFARNEGLAAEGHLAYQAGHHLFMLRGSVVAEVLGDGMMDVGFLYGRAWSGGRSHSAVSAGLGLVDSAVCPSLLTGGDCQDTYTWGVPLSMEGSLRPMRFLGLGLQGFANLNLRHSFAGALLTFRLGALR